MSKLDQLGQDLLVEEYGKYTPREAKHSWWEEDGSLKVCGDFGSDIDNYNLDTIIEHLYSRITDLEKQLQQKGE